MLNYIFILVTLSTVTCLATDVTFARHGESTWNVENKMQGQGILLKDKNGNFHISSEEIGAHQVINGVDGEIFLDSAKLTEKGQIQAENLGKKIKNSLKEGDSLLLLSSDLLRAKETSSIVEEILKAEGVDVTVQYDSRFREANHGIISGMQETHYKSLKCFQDYKLLSPEKRFEVAMDPEHGESSLNLTARVHQAVMQYLSEYPDKKIVVVTHGGVIRGLMASFTNNFSSFSDGYENGKIKNCATMTIHDYENENTTITLD